MIKKLTTVLTLLLAINFLAVAGGVGWLFMSGKLDREKVAAVREMLFPPPAAGPEVVTTQPSTRPTNGPAAQLDDLLAKYAGRRVGEQMEMVQQSVDAQAAALDRRTRELDDLMGQILREKADLAQKSTALDAERQRVTEREQQQVAQASDQGFQDTLKLYQSMPPKNAKAAFMAMPDEAVARYLQAMSPRTATKVIKEFKTPPEQERINRVMERVRSGKPDTRPAAGPPAVAGTPASPAEPVPGFASSPPRANGIASPAAGLPRE